MISIVVPVFNEEESLEPLYKALTSELPKLAKTHEILFVDDGSTDSSLSILKDFAKNNMHVRVFSFRKNQGKAEALTLGFQEAKGDQIFTLDADLQDKPSEMHKLLDKLESFDLVCGWRKNRQDASAKIASSKLFNFFTKTFWGLQLHDYNCGLKAYTKDAAKSLALYGGLHRFIPLLVYEEGFSVTEVPILHERRRFGKSKYGFSKLWKDMPDIFTMLFLARYSKRPLHFFGTVGSLLFLTGFLIFSYLSILWLGGESIGRRPLLIFSVLLMLGGLQVFVTGFIAELVISVSQKNNNSFPLKYVSDTV